MNPSMRLSVLGLFLAVTPAASQELSCNEGESLEAFVVRVGQASADVRQRTDNERASKKEATVAAALAAAAPFVADRPSSLESPDSAGSRRDILSQLFTALSLGNANDKDGDLTLDLSPEWLSVGPNHPFAFRVVVRQPKLTEQTLKSLEALDAAVRSTVRTQLEDDLEDFDDTEYNLTWLPTSSDKDPVRVAAEGALDRLFDRQVQPFLARTDEVIQDFLARLARVPENSQCSDLAPDQLRQLSDALQAAVKATSDLDIAAAIKDSPYQKLAAVVDGRPQFAFSGALRRRVDVLGADERTLSAKFSWSPGYLSLKAACPGWEVGCIEERVPEHPSLAWRLAVEARYADREGNAVTLPEHGELLARISGRETTAAFTLGRTIALGKDGSPNGRVDIEGKYENISDDPARQSRLVATATLSQRVSSTADAGITLIYANKPEFRGEVDTEFSARAGLKFKLPTKSQ